MFGSRVENPKARGIRHWHGGKGFHPAIDQHEPPCFAKHGYALVEDAAGHTHKFIFRLTAPTCQIDRGNRQSEQFAQRNRGGQFKRGTAGQTGAGRQIARDGQIETARKRSTVFLQRPSHPQWVIGPRRRTLERGQIVQSCFDNCPIGRTKNADAAVGPPAGGHLYSAVNGRANDQAAVVINVIADEFQASRGIANHGRSVAKLLLENRGGRIGHEQVVMEDGKWAQGKKKRPPPNDGRHCLLHLGA